MNFSKEKPPIFDRLHEEFGVEWGGDLCVAYNDTIYHSKPLHPSVIIHEQVHLNRQKDDTQWWERYIRDKRFRFTEELLAYREQYKFLKATIKDRNKLARHQWKLAQDLSSKMYGNVVSHAEALRIIALTD